jgi:ectoine hydroxylase-related dioxygenase (phytanoyl-CoA dioxygenase family)
MKNNAEPLTQRQLFEFDLAGYTIIEGFLPEQQVREMNRAIDHHLGEELPIKFPFLGLGETFLNLMSDERVMQICDLLLGKGFRLDTMFGIQYPAANKAQAHGSENLHAGPYASQGVFRYHWFNNKPQCGLIVFVYFLEPVDEGDGGLVLVPGSHKVNLNIEARDVFRKLLNRKLDAWWLHNPSMKAGDLLIFNEAVMHGTKRWTRVDRRRRNLHYS